MSALAGAQEPCPACESLPSRPWSEKDGFPLSRCTRCGALFAPSTAAAATGALYEHYYDQATFALAPASRLSLERVVDRFAPYRQTGKLLDVGFGEGALLRVAEAKGWACHGTELSPGAVEHGRRQGWQVTLDPSQDPAFAPAGFDVVAMIELLEHLTEPRRVIESAFRWLRPGGLLFLTTPNGHSLNRWLLGSDWSIFGPPEHMTIWTARAVRLALQRCGFERVRMRTEGLNPCELLQRAGRAGNGSRNEEGARLNEALSRSPARLRLKQFANGALSVLRLGDTLKATAIRPAVPA